MFVCTYIYAIMFSKYSSKNYNEGHFQLFLFHLINSIDLALDANCYPSTIGLKTVDFSDDFFYSSSFGKFHKYLVQCS